MAKILVISTRYPNIIHKTNHIFVQQLVWALSDLGHKCIVVSPIARNINSDLNEKIAEVSIEINDNGKEIKILYPRYCSLSKHKYLMGIENKATLKNYYKSILKAVNMIDFKPDLVYGHFIDPAGITASRIGRILNIPAYFAYGESTLWSIKKYRKKWLKKELASVKGVIAVSNKNKDILVEQALIDKNKIGVFPNAVRKQHFYKRNKSESRRFFGFDNKEFIVSFVGQFNKRKGVDRLDKAVEELEGVKAIYAGKGAIKPRSKKTLYCDIVEPNEMPLFLSASDVFVLPTINEGCSNAIIEAMACGLPIISSDLSFNYDILDENNSIMVNPMDVSQIKNSILTIKDNIDLREKMGRSSLEKSALLNYEDRARNIMNWIMGKNCH